MWDKVAIANVCECVFFFDHWVVGIELVTDDAKLHLEFTLAVATSKWISAFKPHHLLNAQKVLKFGSFSQISNKLKNCARIRD